MDDLLLDFSEEAERDRTEGGDDGRGNDGWLHSVFVDGITVRIFDEKVGTQNEKAI